MSFIRQNPDPLALDTTKSVPDTEANRVKIYGLAPGNDGDAALILAMDSMPPADLSGNEIAFSAGGTSPVINEIEGHFPGGALVFPHGWNTASYIHADASSSSINLTGDFTIDVWFKNAIKPSGGQTLFSIWSDDDQDAIQLYTTVSGFNLFSGEITIGGSFVDTISSADPWQIGRWSLASFEREGDIWRLYLDGKLQSEKTFAAEFPQPLTKFWIGRTPTGYLQMDTNSAIQSIRLSTVARYQGASYRVPDYQWGCETGFARDNRGVSRTVGGSIASPPIALPDFTRMAVIPKNNPDNINEGRAVTVDANGPIYAVADGTGKSNVIGLAVERMFWNTSEARIWTCGHVTKSWWGGNLPDAEGGNLVPGSLYYLCTDPADAGKFTAVRPTPGPDAEIVPVLIGLTPTTGRLVGGYPIG